MTDVPALKHAQGELDKARKDMRDFLKESGPDYDMSRVKMVDGDNAEKLDWLRSQNDKINELKTKRDGIAAVAKDANDYVEGDEDRGEKSESLGAGVMRGFKEYGRNRATEVKVDLKTLFQRTDGYPPEVTRSGRVELQAVKKAVQVTDFLPKFPISQSSYKYMVEDAFTNTAAERAEGATYAEAELSLTETSKPVEKITIWIPVTDEQLEDEDSARAYIDMRLRYMIQARLDSQIINGDGTAPNLSGVLDQAGLNNVVNATASAHLIDSLGELFTEVRTVGFAEPNVAFVTPTEKDLILRAKDANNNYLWGHPSRVGPETIWGVRMEAPIGILPAGTRAVVGDFANYSGLFIRRGLNVQVSNSHSTHFVEGKQAIRADMRALVAYFRPSAFGTVTTA